MASNDVVGLLSALGRTASRDVIVAYCKRGTKAIAPLLDALLAPPKLPQGEPVNGRAYLEDEEDCLRALCRAHPRAFVREVKRRPELLERLPVLSSISEVPGPTTAAWLVDALSSRNGWLRWVATEALTRREEPKLVEQLERLLRDRDSLVVFAAVAACRRLGRAEHVPLLEALSEKPNIGIGTRERVFDAIEILCERHGAPLPPIHPGKRLVIVRGQHPELSVTEFLTEATQVPRGKILASGGGMTLEAPTSGVVSFIDRYGDTLEFGIRKAATRSRGPSPSLP